MLDKFLDFTFDGVKSSEYNCFYQNTGEELSLPPYSVFTDQISTPLYQKASYYLGTSIGNRSFSFRCWVHDLSMNKFRELMLWLSPEKVGNLELPYIPNYHFTVKISSFSTPVIFPVTADDANGFAINAEFLITFTTIGDYAAISNYEYNFNLNGENEGVINLDFETRIPVIDYMSDTRIRLFNPKPYELFPRFICNNISATKISVFDNNNYYQNSIDGKKPVVWYNYDFKKGETPYNIKIDTKHGFCLNTKTDELIERDFRGDWDIQEQFLNNGACAVKPGNIRSTYMTLVDAVKVNDKELSLKFSPEEIDSLSWFNEGSPVGDDLVWEENTACNGVFAILKKDEDTLLYNEGSYNTGGYYLNEHYSYFTYHYKRETNLLELRIKTRFESGKETVEHHLNWFAQNINQLFKISILKYTEFTVETDNTAKHEGAIIPTEIDNSVSFNLRTLF